MGNHSQSAFAKRVAEAGLTFQDLAFLTNVSQKRINHHSQGKIELTEAEMARVNVAVSRAAVVYTVFKREIANAAAVTITTGKDGVMDVSAAKAGA